MMWLVERLVQPYPAAILERDGVGIGFSSTAVMPLRTAQRFWFPLGCAAAAGAAQCIGCLGDRDAEGPASPLCLKLLIGERVDEVQPMWLQAHEALCGLCQRSVQPR